MPTLDEPGSASAAGPSTGTLDGLAMPPNEPARIGSGEIMASERTNLNKGSYIDVHAHVFPDFYASAMRAAGVRDVDGWPNPKWSVEAMFKAMDEHKIAVQMLSVSSPGVTYAEGRTAADLARRLNEFMAGLVEEHAPRLGSLAILPLPDVEASLAEIAHALDTLGMDGFGLLSNYRGVNLGDPKLDPVLAELNRRKAAVFVHPTISPHWESFAVGIPAPVMEYTFDSTRMAQHLVMTGAKAKFLDVAIIVAHGGAMLPLSRQRLVKYWMDGKNDIFDTFFSEFTATTEHSQIRALMEFAKPERCMMGFDFHFMKPDWYDPLQHNLESYGFSPDQLRAVRSGNALRLFPKVKGPARRGWRTSLTVPARSRDTAPVAALPSGRRLGGSAHAAVRGREADETVTFPYTPVCGDRGSCR